ncbi:MAG: autotransporter-associated beta strand repeat-containing protein, partial [Verrucomicrobiota bacterium]
MKKQLLIAFATLGFCLGASADTVALWDFNSRPSDTNDTTGTLTPTTGSGLASVVGAVAPSFTTANGSSDPAGTNDNSNWRITTFAAVSSNNKTRGVQFNMNTIGFENITAVWDQQNSATANRYWRVLYSIDNGATWVERNVIDNTANAVWTNGVFSADFTSIPGANNNTNFGVRLLAEFQSTATGSGVASYVGVGGTYGTGGTLRLDMFRFSGSPVANLTIFSQPSSLTVAVGQPATFSVVAGGGQPPIGYQWRFESNAIPSATQSSYTISSAQLTNSGAYDVVITNATTSITSSVVTLNVRTPLNLAWTGQSSPVWDESSVNWINTASLTPAAYSTGDHTLFDVRGISSPQVNLAQSLTPSSVTVNADFDYLLRSDVGGKIIGTTGLTKRGAGTLQIDADNNYSGPTIIEAGTLQLGVASDHGSFGSGPVTNNGALVFNRTNALTLPNNISGTGTITNLGKTVTLTGNNVYNGDIAVPSGVLLLNGNQTVNSPNVTLSSLLPTSGAQTSFGISGGISTSPSTALTTYGNNLSGDYRVKFYTTSGTNTWNGPIYLSGSAGSVVNAVQSDAASAELRINGDITGIDGFANALFFRGTGSVLMNGHISLPGVIVNKTDAGIWTLNSTGNDWLGTALVVGTLRIGTNDALPTALSITMGQANTTATLDLNGFNQQVASVQDSPGSPGVPIITNSSTVSDSVLTLSASGGTLGALIKDGALHKLGLTINSGSLNLRSNCTYSGATTLTGTLSLSGDGAISNSSTINL